MATKRAYKTRRVPKVRKSESTVLPSGKLRRTIYIEEQYWAALKKESYLTTNSISSLIEEAVKEYLEKE